MSDSYALAETAVKLNQLQPLAEHALSHFGEAFQGKVSLLTHSENSTYVVTTTSGERYVMRVHRDGYHSKAEIQSELAWLVALGDAGIEVPVPIPGLSGEVLQEVHYPGQVSRFVVLFHWINGNQPSTDELLSSFQRLGMMTAKLHEQSRVWKRPAWFVRPTWTHETMVCERAPWGRWQEAPYLDDAGRCIISAVVEKIRVAMEGYGSAPELFGLIHADLRLTNLLVEGQHTRIIDFDDCGFSWLMHDLAAAMSFFEHDPALGTWIENWLTGYVRCASLTAADVDIIPSLVVQRRIQLLAWTGTHQGTPQVDCLGAVWVKQTVQLAEQYLRGELLTNLAGFKKSLGID